MLDACHREVGAAQSHDGVEHSLASRTYLKGLLDPAFRGRHDFYGSGHSNTEEVECASLRVCD